MYVNFEAYCCLNTPSIKLCPFAQDPSVDPRVCVEKYPKRKVYGPIICVAKRKMISQKTYSNKKMGLSCHVDFTTYFTHPLQIGSKLFELSMQILDVFWR